MIPLYAGVDKETYKPEMLVEGLNVPTGATEDTEAQYLICNVKIYNSPLDSEEAPVTTYFLENEEYYEKRANVYGYSDDAIRWALLGRGVLEFFVMRPNWVPDVIVAADWQGAFVINYLKTEYKNTHRFKNTASGFSIHNLYYQG